MELIQTLRNLSPSNLNTVKKLGLSCYKNVMSEGNLHIRFEVQFLLLGQIKNEQIEQLKFLHGPKQQAKLDGKKTFYFKEYMRLQQIQIQNVVKKMKKMKIKEVGSLI